MSKIIVLQAIAVVVVLAAAVMLALAARQVFYFRTVLNAKMKEANLEVARTSNSEKAASLKDSTDSSWVAEKMQLLTQDAPLKFIPEKSLVANNSDVEFDMFFTSALAQVHKLDYEVVWPNIISVYESVKQRSSTDTPNIEFNLLHQPYIGRVSGTLISNISSYPGLGAI
jgi:hypothetical protein